MSPLVLLGFVLALGIAMAVVGIGVETPDEEIDRATALAVRTLRHNVSEKWGKLCPTAAPAWMGSSYLAWIHPYDNFWMGKVTPYLFPKEQVAWPVILFSKYQAPSGMIGWGVHDCESPEATRAQMAGWTPEQIAEHARSSRYIRDHLFIMQVYDLWFATGDAKLLRQLYLHCLHSLEYLAAYEDEDQDGLIESADIIEDIDVGAFENRTGPNAVERFVDQAALYGALRNMIVMAQALNDAETAQRTAAQAEALKRRCNAQFWNEQGYYLFALDARTHQPLHTAHASTWANGYAILWGMVDDTRAAQMLDYLTRWEFTVPGPILIPPLTAEMSTHRGSVHLPPGVYANGGCGWGRGYMPSVCLACFRRGRTETAMRYLHDQAAAANRAGAFYEYWNWEQYVGNSEPGGCRDYSETASGFLDALVHGLFGIRPMQPGFAEVEIAPRLPAEWPRARLTLDLPDGGRLTYEERKNGAERTIQIALDGRRVVHLSLESERPPAVITLGERPIAFTTHSHYGRFRVELAWMAEGESALRIHAGENSSHL